MKEQFIKFLEDNNCFNPWVTGVYASSGRTLEEFTFSQHPNLWISSAFDWANTARKYYVDWFEIHKLWVIYFKQHSHE